MCTSWGQLIDKVFSPACLALFHLHWFLSGLKWIFPWWGVFRALINWWVPSHSVAYLGLTWLVNVFCKNHAPLVPLWLCQNRFQVFSVCKWVEICCHLMAVMRQLSLKYLLHLHGDRCFIYCVLHCLLPEFCFSILGGFILVWILTAEFVGWDFFPVRGLHVVV